MEIVKSGIASVSEDYLLKLKKTGKEFYKDMRAAEEEWLCGLRSQAVQFYDLQRRRVLVIVEDPKIDLPSTAALIKTRQKFSKYVQENLNGKPETIGVRSTSLPVWLSPQGKYSIEDPVSDRIYAKAIKVNVRQHNAYRSGILTREDVVNYFDSRMIKKLQTSQNYDSSGHRSRAANARLEYIGIKEHKDHALALMEKYSEITVRISSGSITKLQVKTAKDSFATTISNVALLYGDLDTAVLSNTNKRNTSSRLKKFGEVDNLHFYAPRDEVNIGNN